MKRTEQEGGAVIISYDDGDSCDYDRALPIHRRYGVPAEVCAVSGYADKPGRLTRGQMLELQGLGWEIVSHTKNHYPLGEEAVVADAPAGTKTLYTLNCHRFRPGMELLVRQGKRSERVGVKRLGRDTGGAYLELEEGLAQSFGGRLQLRGARGFSRLVKGVMVVFNRLRSLKRPSAFVTVTDEQAGIEIRTSKEELVAMGLDVKHFTFPWNTHCALTRALVARTYHSARAGVVRGEWRSNRCGRYALAGVCFEQDRATDRALEEMLERTRQEDALCVLFAHPRSETFSEERLDWIIRSCLRDGIRIVTRSAYFGGGGQGR